MEATSVAIQKTLQDPSWGLSTVPIGVIVGILAGFGKDWLEKRFGIFLNWSAAKRQQRKAEREDSISMWSSSEGMVTIIFSLLLLRSLFFFGFGTVTLMIFLSPPDQDAIILPVRIALGVFPLFLSIYGFKLTYSLALVADILKAFTKSRSLPSIGL